MTQTARRATARVMEQKDARIEELEAKLAVAVEALDYLQFYADGMRCEATAKEALAQILGDQPAEAEKPVDTHATTA